MLRHIPRKGMQTNYLTWAARPAAAFRALPQLAFLIASFPVEPKAAIPLLHSASPAPVARPTRPLLPGAGHKCLT